MVTTGMKCDFLPLTHAFGVFTAITECGDVTSGPGFHSNLSNTLASSCSVSANACNFARTRGDGRFFQFQDDGQLGGQRLQCRGPVDGSLVGQQMLVALAVIVVNVSCDNEIAHGFQRGSNAALDMRVPGVEAQLHIGKARLLEEVFKIHGRRHFARRVFDGDGNATLPGKQRKMLQ